MPVEKRKRAITLEDKISYLYAQKMSLRDIAEQCNISHETVRKKLGKDVRKKNRLKVSPKKVIRFYHRYGAMATAKEFNITRQYIHYLARNYKE